MAEQADEVAVDDYAALLAIARREARRRITPSAQHVADDLASRAMGEYLGYVERQHEAGRSIDNPAGLIVTIVRRQASKHRPKWEATRGIPPVAEDRSFGGAADGDDQRATPGVVAEDQRLGAEDLLLAVEVREQVEWAVTQLDGTERRIAELAFLAEPPLNDKQIAAELGLAHGTVRNKKVRVRAQLTEWLTDDDSELDDWE